MKAQDVFIAGSALSVADVYLASSLANMQAIDKLLVLSEDTAVNYEQVEQVTKTALDLKYPCVSLWLQNLDREKIFKDKQAELDTNFITPFL